MLINCSNWIDVPQNSSSEWSEQSGLKSHTNELEMHLPLPQVNEYSGHDGDSPVNFQSPK